MIRFLYEMSGISVNVETFLRDYLLRFKGDIIQLQVGVGEACIFRPLKRQNLKFSRRDTSLFRGKGSVPRATSEIQHCVELIVRLRKNYVTRKNSILLYAFIGKNRS